MALPVSAGYQARIDRMNAGIDGLPGQFNPRRRSAAFDTAAGLNESGYFRGITPEETNTGGNLTYKLVRGADGRLYQQAFRANAQAANNRGTFYSSFTERAQSDSRSQLDAARNAILRQFGSGQADLTGQQAAADAQYRGDLGTTRGEYADWQAAQPVPTPPAPAGGASPGAPAPVQPGTLATPTSTPGSFREWTGSSTPNLKNLARAWGVSTSAVRVTPVAGGKYRAWAQAAPNSGPRF